MRTATLAAFLVLTGCPASVTAEGIEEGFGLPISAAWVHTTGGGAASDLVVISSVGDLCTKEEDYYSALKEWTTAVMSITEEDYCGNLEDPLTHLVESSQAMQFKGASYVYLSVGSDFDEGEYSFGSGASGSIVAFDDTPYEGTLEDFDKEGNIGNVCGLGAVDTDAAGGWTLKDGSVKLDSVNEEGVASGSADGTMVAANGESDGDFAVTFAASWCELEL